MLFTDTGMSKVADNTSAVISFKLPSVLESCGKKQVSCRRNNSSSSSDEADTIPFQTSAHRQRGSMSTQKPSIKSTPDFRSGTGSLAACMNLSVRRTKTRRGPGGTGLVFGLPMRVKMPLPAVSEPGDELDGIAELESTVDEFQQSCEPEVARRSQGNHLAGSSVRTASSSSDAEHGTDQGPPTHESHKETSTVDESLQSCEPEVAPRSQGNHLAGSSVHTASSSSEADRDPLTDQRPPTREYHKETFSYKLEKSTDNHTAEITECLYITSNRQSSL
ncbi:hypothetical protein OS493_019676 [Desmophyllum pertusum]|uniref:Uncharacterized protein n=1 Tax=Desmophyllum pertusum TaxID=174260 RepID=A0A9W9YZD7_9CNID|nr:hypothetical protein OS493_019676 [Desmophyllum pertusum]